MERSFKKAIGAEKDKDDHLASVLEFAQEHRNANALAALVTSVRTEYKVPKRQLHSLGDMYVGNSEHNFGTAAWKQKNFHSLEALKAMYIVHRALNEYPEVVLANAGSYLDWMENGVIKSVSSVGYGPAARRYATYLRTLVTVRSLESSMEDGSICNDIKCYEQRLLAVKIAATSELQDLKSSLRHETSKLPHTKAVNLIFKTVVADADEFDFTA